MVLLGGDRGQCEQIGTGYENVPWFYQSGSSQSQIDGEEMRDIYKGICDEGPI